MNRLVFLCIPILLASILGVSGTSFAQVQKKKIVLIAGEIDGGHPKGTHEYQKTIKLFAQDLMPLGQRLNFDVETHFEGWPKDEKTLDSADTIVLVSDGCDRNLTSHPFFVGQRLKTIEKQMDRGCGLVLVHWSTFWPEAHRDKVLDWVGGYFDYETGPEPRLWYSKIDTFRSDCAIASTDHPVAAGVKRFPLREEFYFNLRFAEEDRGTVYPIVQTRALDEPEIQTVGWAFQRESGGRGFGFTGGHFFENWREPNLRKVLENAILWTAKVDMPPRGVITKQTPKARGEVDTLDPNKINVALITGNQHPAHLWRQTSAVITDAIAQDKRTAVAQKGIEFLEDPNLQDYDTIVFNYCNWQEKGLSEKAKSNFTKFIRRGGGLVLVHFANGAFHASLPDTPASDWPEYRNICRRVWDHNGDSGHDAFGKFQVDITQPTHPIMTGVSSFETVDELYFRQAGELPIEVLATAKSRMTDQDEPMAFVYQYGRGKVFQTVLGHAAESIRTPGTSRMIKNAVAWTSGNQVYAETDSNDAIVAVDQSNKAFDARTGFIQVSAKDKNLSLIDREVRCRFKLKSKNTFNILVAQHPKPSRHHWELYSYAGTGELSLFLSGYEPAEIKSGIDVCDDKWHTASAEFDGETVTLTVDGELVKRQKVKRIQIDDQRQGPLIIGALASQQFGCDGLIDEVNMYKWTARSEPPEFAGTWKFNETAIDKVSDSSPLKQTTTFVRTGVSDEYLAKWTPKSRRNSRFPYENEKDPDWVDNRFSFMDTGPVFCHSIQIPGRGMIPKAIAVRGSKNANRYWIFNSEKLRLESVWSGDFLALPPARFGILKMPSVAGQVEHLCSDSAGWKVERNGELLNLDQVDSHFSNTTLLGSSNVGFTYRVDDFEISEQLTFETIDQIPVTSRTFTVSKLKKVSDAQLFLNLGSSKNPWAWATTPNLKSKNDKDQLVLQFDFDLTGDSTQQFRIDYVSHPNADQLFDLIKAFEPKSNQSIGILRWGRPIETQGVLGGTKDTQAFAVDTITVPYKNPFNALMFTSGFDFLPDGRALVCTVHGDVWLVDGIDDDLDQLTWQRFATGLYQPLGLKVVGDKPIVVCRDRLVRLEDSDNNGEADIYHNFNDDLVVTGQGHAYAMSLETDPQGNFYFIKSGGTPPHGGTMVKVKADGSEMEVFATGYRHANGLGVSPSGVVTSADNEGNWIPATRIDVVSKGGFYGHMPTHRRDVAPSTYDSPLMWMPRDMDNSAGGQVWVDSSTWKSLQGTMLHLSYGRCTANVVLPQQLNDKTWQAAAYKLDITPFISGSMRGRFNPKDGHLYVCGLDGWQTAAVRDGCFQRVRATSKKHYQPIGFKANGKQIEIQFPESLDPDSVKTASWSIEQWNYRYSKQYGSDHYSVKDPDAIGHDSVTVNGIQLSNDFKTITLTIDELKPVMQMNIKATFKAQDGFEIDLDLYNTINRL